MTKPTPPGVKHAPISKAAPPPKPPPRGIQLHNPGNIKRQWDGKKEITPAWEGMSKDQPDPTFVKFDSDFWGLRAMGKSILNDQQRHNHWTLKGLITPYAPKSDGNNTKQYIADVATALGIPDDQIINLQANRELLEQLLTVMVVKEVGHGPGGKPWFRPDEISKAVDAALVGMPAKASPKQSHSPSTKVKVKTKTAAAPHTAPKVHSLLQPPLVPKMDTAPSEPDGTRDVYGKVLPKSSSPVEPSPGTAAPLTPAPRDAPQASGYQSGIENVAAEDPASFSVVESTDDESTSETDDSSGGGQLAARFSDRHKCPGSTGMIAHVGGPVIHGSKNTYIQGEQAARVGDLLACTGGIDAIASGSTTIYINGQPAARINDKTEHGGTVASGADSVHFA